MSKKFVTIFPEAQNVHLRKDVGKIPYVLFRDYGYDSSLVCFDNGPYPTLQNDVPGLKLTFFKHQNKKQPLLACIRYLLRNAADIDVLHLFGQSRWTFITACIYRLLNRKGILYLKLDMNIEYLDGLQKSKHSSRHLRSWNFFFKKIASLVSCEYHTVLQALTRFYTIDQKKLIQLPNGVDDIALKKLPFGRLALAQKENIILTAGRIGAWEKNHQMLLAAIAKMNLKNWKVVFAGPIDAVFKHNFIDPFFAQRPELRSSVLFVGKLEDYESLCAWYNKAKIFVLPSLREGFPLVIPEAMYWGNYIVSNNVSSIHEILDGGAIGSLVNNEEDLHSCLQQLIDNETMLQSKTPLSIKKAEEELNWSKIISQLHHKLNELAGS